MQYAKYNRGKKTHIVDPTNPNVSLCGAWLLYTFDILLDGVEPHPDHICEKCLRKVKQE